MKLSNESYELNVDAIMKAEDDLENLLEEEEDYWRNRCREVWLKNGDKNTKWFHAKATQRRQRNYIEGILSKQGEWEEDDAKIGNIATEYFRRLFLSSDPDLQHVQQVVNCVSSKISDQQRAKLDQPYDRSEIEIAIKSLSPNKAPGSNGAHASFYQGYWDTVGEETIKVCLQILNEDADLKPLNKTIIALIPKVKDPKQMKDFRPISSCNVSYKIIAKTIANRFKKVLDSIISPTQAAFVPGRLITDNVIIGFECIHAIRQKIKLVFF